MARIRRRARPGTFRYAAFFRMSRSARSRTIFFIKAGIWARSARSCPFPGKTSVAHFYRLINHLFDVLRCLRCGVSFVLCSSHNDANLRSCTDRKVSPATKSPPLYAASVDLDARLTDDGPPAGIFLPSEPIGRCRIHPDRFTAKRS